MDVFVSYSHKDTEFVKKMCGILKSHGLSYWAAYENKDSADDSAEKILNRISNAKVLLVFVSKNSNQSRHVINELNCASMCNKPILPVIIDDVEMSNAFEFYVSSSNRLCYSQSGDFTEKFVDTIRSMIDSSVPVEKKAVQQSSLKADADRKRKKIAVAIVAILTLLAVAIGVAVATNFSTSDSVSDKEETKEDETKEDETKTKRKIVVGYTIYEPMNYKDANGELVGFDTELAKIVFKNLGYDEVIFKEIEWSDKYTELESGAIDCIWNGFTSNASYDDGTARSEKLDLSYNYMQLCQVVVAKNGSGITSSADLAGKLGCAESGSAGEWYADVLDAENITLFVDQQDCFLAVKMGKAGFAIADSQFAESRVGYGDYADLEIVESLSSEIEYYAVAFKKGSDLTAQVNAQIEALAADGTMAALAEKYGLSYSVITDFSDQK